MKLEQYLLLVNSATCQGIAEHKTSIPDVCSQPISQTSLAQTVNSQPTYISDDRNIRFAYMLAWCQDTPCVMCYVGENHFEGGGWGWAVVTFECKLSLYFWHCGIIDVANIQILHCVLQQNHSVDSYSSARAGALPYGKREWVLPSSGAENRTSSHKHVRRSKVHLQLDYNSRWSARMRACCPTSVAIIELNCAKKTWTELVCAQHNTLAGSRLAFECARIPHTLAHFAKPMSYWLIK